MARPMPRVDPVMTATRSVSEKSDISDTSSGESKLR
jgi:hypothetical protein